MGKEFGKVTRDDFEGYSIIHLPEEMDLGRAAVLDHKLQEMQESGRKFVIIDMTRNIFFDAPTLGALLESLRWLEANGGQMIVIPGQEVSRMLLRISGLDGVAPIKESLQEAEELVKTMLQERR